MRLQPRHLLVSLGLLLPGILTAQGMGSGPANEQEAAVAAPVPATWLPGARAGDPNQSTARARSEREAKKPGLLRSSVGVLAEGNQIRGAGADYKVTFESEHVLYTPALPAAPHNMPVDFRVQSYGRGSASQTVTAAKLGHNGNTILYTRPEFVESWELKPEGIKQSFTFDKLPAGQGDLVVRMLLQSELVGRQDGVDSMSMNLEGIGGVSIKDVVGIDANGARIQGSLHYEGSVLELRLPGAAVDQAALPLVLDPLVGTTIVTVATTYVTHDSDAAFDEAANVWLVVYTRNFSATDTDIHGQRVNTAGGLVGGVLLIDDSASTIDSSGRVSTINSQNTFCVVYRRDNAAADDIRGKAVRAADGVFSSTSYLLVSSANNLGQPDIGGEATLTDNDGILVWTDFTTGEINAKQISVIANSGATLPTVTPFATVVLIGDVAATWSNSTPAITESGGDTGNHCIVWMRQFTGNVNTSVRAAIVDRNLVVLDSFIAVADTEDNDSPDVDGNGRNWVVAWDKETTSANGDPGIYARALGWNPNGTAGNQGYFVSNAVVVEDDLNDAERTPAVAWTGEAVLIAYVDDAGTHNDIFANMIDLYTCALCRTTDYTIDSTTDEANSPSIASGRSAGENNVRSLIIYQWIDVTSPPAGSNADIRSIRFDADEGTISELGGGCGTGGHAAASCAISPNSAFTMRLRGAAPSGSNFLVLSPTALNLICGSCTLIPNPYTGFVSTGTNNTLGDRTVSLPIPSSVVGASLLMQFITAGTNCFGGFDLSNAVRITVQ